MSQGSASMPTRFKIVRRIGAGGMGIVYEAIDRERGERVALKTIRSYSGPALVRFKREFRALQDLHHPNVVTLGELISVGDDWFFTMELVDGVDFLDHVRGTDRARRGGDHMASLATASISGERPTLEESAPDTGERPISDGAKFDEARLRAALPQLVDAICTLHGAGLVHRDIKPSNIRIDKDDRVVLLDFGVVGDVDDDHLLSANRTVGTPEYMAPEQAVGDAAGPAADWYSVGVLLYEALTGQLPFQGAAVMTKKQWAEPAAPSTIAPDVPRDLEALCMALLRFDPTARPTGELVSLALGATETRPRSLRAPSLPFVGRGAELDVLRTAFDDARAHGTVSVFVRGESGVGKTCLLRHFVDTLATTAPKLLVLSGRCYERESVPFKAFDGVVDALARALSRLAPKEVTALVPPSIGSLAQVFPVLRSVDAIVRIVETPRTDLDPIDLRRRAFAAMRTLLARIAEKNTVVVIIDDVQWADADSRTMMDAVLSGEDAPKLLLLATKRTSADTESARVEADFASALPGEVRTIDLTRLTSSEACELAAGLLAQARRDARLDPAWIAREAGGHPLFIDALVRHEAPHEGRVIRLEDALRSRVEALDDASKSALELLAVAQAPISQEALARALGPSATELTKRLASLRASHLVITAGMRSRDHVDLFHDRLRATILAYLEGEARVALHRRLAEALASSDEADPEMLANQWRGAGDLARAAHFTRLAADRAAAALAFARAARLYQAALTLHEASDDDRRALNAKLGEVLANLGRGALAAKAFLAAAEGAPAEDALARRRRAAAQLLRAGHVDEGLDAIRAVLASIGWHMPATPRVARFLEVLRRMYIFVRGLSYRERPASEIPPMDLAKIDVAWSTSHSLAMIDFAQGATYQALHLVLALDAGEPLRVARAFASEAMTIGSLGGKAWPRTEKLITKTLESAARTGRPEVIGWSHFACGYAHYLNGKFKTSLAELETSHRMLRECSGMVYELTTIQRTLLMCLAHKGELRELCTRRPLYLREAFDRGDLYGVVNLRLGYSNIAWLVVDDADEARTEIAESMRNWSKAGFHLEHYFALIARANADLYSGQPGEALQIMRERWPGLRASQLLAVQTVRVLARAARARCALATGDRALLDLAHRDALALHREHADWAGPLAHLLDAGIAWTRDRDAGRTRTSLEAAASGFDRVDMVLQAAAARRVLGALIGGDEGAALVRDADGWMTAEGVVNPARMAAMLAPGLAL